MLAAVAITSLTFGLVLYLVLGNAQERLAVRAGLRRLSEVEFDNARQREMLEPLGARALRPLVAHIVALGHRFTPAGYAAAARRKLTLAGRNSTKSFDAFLAVRVVTAAAEA